jgi:hypothetical protein
MRPTRFELATFGLKDRSVRSEFRGASRFERFRSMEGTVEGTEIERHSEPSPGAGYDDS